MPCEAGRLNAKLIFIEAHARNYLSAHISRHGLGDNRTAAEHDINKAYDYAREAWVQYEQLVERNRCACKECAPHAGGN